MPVQARRVQVIVARNLGRRFAGGEAAVDLGRLDAGTCDKSLTCPKSIRPNIRETLIKIPKEIPTKGDSLIEKSAIFGSPICFRLCAKSINAIN